MVRRLRPRPATFLGATDMASDTVLGWLSLRSFYGRPAYAWNECMGTYVSGLQAQAKTAIAVANEAVVVSQQRALGAVLRREVYGCCPDDSIERLGRDGTLRGMLRISTETPPRRFDRRGNWRGIRSPVTSAAASRQRSADRNGDQKKDPRRAAPTEGYPVTRDTRAIQRFFPSPQWQGTFTLTSSDPPPQRAGSRQSQCRAPISLLRSCSPRYPRHSR